MVFDKYRDYILEELRNLIGIDSPGGMTREAADYVFNELKKIGYAPEITNKGGVIVCLGGNKKSGKGGLLFSGHIDTLGAMVSQVKSNGRLKMRSIGGVNLNTVDSENVVVYARDGRKYEGTIQFNNPSVHVNPDARTTVRNWDNVEVVLDEETECAADTRALGIETGCYVCFDPRFIITEKGYIKSRFLDDKLPVAIMLGYAKYLKDEKVKPEREIWMHFTIYEEIGHGAAGICPEGVSEIVSVDMGCVGGEMAGNEKLVSICAMDASGPYNYYVNCALIEAAKKAGIGYAVDVYPSYSSDSSVAVKDFDLLHSVIGPGVYASHGYERSHIEGAGNTFELIREYVASF